MSDSRYYYLCAIGFMVGAVANGSGYGYLICAAGSIGYIIAANRAFKKESK